MSNKFKLYENLPRSPNLVIFGSSRTFIHSASYIKESFGYDTFNFGVANASLVDASIQMRFIDAAEDGRFPEVLFIETLPDLASSKVNAAKRASFAMLPYMDIEMAGYFLSDTGSDLMSIHTFTEALYTLQSFSRNPDTRSNWTFLPDGSGVRNILTGDPERFLDLIRNTDNIPTCTNYRPESIELLAGIVQFAYDRNSAVIIYISPWQPDFYVAFMQVEETYLQCQQLFLERIRLLQQAYPNLFFLDFTQIESFGGIADHNGFYDSHHLTSLNSKLLIDAAAPTIHAAYQFALEATEQAP